MWPASLKTTLLECSIEQAGIMRLFLIDREKSKQNIWKVLFFSGLDGIPPGPSGQLLGQALSLLSCFRPYKSIWRFPGVGEPWLGGMGDDFEWFTGLAINYFHSNHEKTISFLFSISLVPVAASVGTWPIPFHLYQVGVCLPELHLQPLYSLPKAFSWLWDLLCCPQGSPGVLGN